MNYTLKIAISIILISCSFFGQAQPFADVLASVEQNNLSLQVLRKQLEAEKEELDLEMRLDDPEVGAGYLWGHGETGQRFDFEASQTFPLPNVYVKRKKVVAEKKRVAELDYLAERQNVLLKAKQLCIQIVYCNAVLHHLRTDMEQTETSAQAYQKMFENGQATVIDRNKSMQASLFFHMEELNYLAQKRDLEDELTLMNGGRAVVVTDSVFSHHELPADFDAFLAETLADHPQYLAIMQKVKASETESQLAKREWCPMLKVGYQSEKTRNEHFQGLTAGLSLPLWSTAKKVKAAKLRAEAARMESDKTKQSVEQQLRNAYNEAKALADSHQMYRNYMNDFNNDDLLKKSLDGGQITLLTYLQELQSMHELHVKVMTAELQYELRRAELYLIP